MQALLAELLVLLLHRGGLREERADVGWVCEVPGLLDAGELDRAVEEGRVFVEVVEAEDLARTELETDRYPLTRNGD